jgi:hypothetical protein
MNTGKLVHGRYTLLQAVIMYGPYIGHWVLGVCWVSRSVRGSDACGYGEGEVISNTLFSCGRTILKRILNRVGGCGLDSSVSGYGPVAGSCEQVNETFEFHKMRGIS